jgi:hypothetical protein
MKRLAVLAALLAYGGAVHAEGNYLGYVQKVGTRGNGTLFVELSEPITQPGCSTSQLEIPASNPAMKSILAVVLAAYFANSRIYVQTDACNGSNPTLSGTNSWLYPVP